VIASRKRTTEKEEVADVVLTVIADKEEVNYLMCEPCTEVKVAETINYTVYTNAENIECLTCEGCKKIPSKGMVWKGAMLNTCCRRR
jgi:hypothetical protein